MNCFLLLDDEKKLSAKDIEWSDLNIPIIGGHRKGLGIMKSKNLRDLQELERRARKSQKKVCTIITSLLGLKN